MGLLSRLKKIFGSSSNEVDLVIESKTLQGTLELHGISEEDYNSSIQDNLNYLLSTQEFEKFYNTLAHYNDLVQEGFDEEHSLKFEIAREVSSIIYDKHQELIKKATQFNKQKNLDEAINTIHKAIKEYPTEDDRKSYFKLAYYYQLQKKWDDSWRVFDRVREKYLNPNNPIEYQILNTELLEEEVKHLKREKRIDEYLYFLPLSVYSYLVMRSMNGSKEYAKNFYSHMDEDFINVSLIKNKEIEKEYLDCLSGFFESKKDDIFKLIKYTEKKTWQQMDKKILSKLLLKLQYHELEDYYNEHLSEKMSVLK